MRSLAHSGCQFSPLFCTFKNINCVSAKNLPSRPLRRWSINRLTRPLKLSSPDINPIWESCFLILRLEDKWEFSHLTEVSEGNEPSLDLIKDCFFLAVTKAKKKPTLGSILESLKSDYSSQQLIRNKKVLISDVLLEQNNGCTGGIRRGLFCISMVKGEKKCHFTKQCFSGKFKALYSH